GHRGARDQAQTLERGSDFGAAWLVGHAPRAAYQARGACPTNGRQVYPGGQAMSRHWFLTVLLPVGVLATAASGRPQKPPDTPAPAAADAQRGLQLRKLAKEFAGAAKYRNAPDVTELRLLPQPVHGYTAPKQGVLTGGLFAFVRGTDPELWLLVEARGADAAAARWQYAAARMTNMAELRLRHRDKPVWEAGLLPWVDVSGSHKRPYTAFEFKETPDFLKDAAKPKP